VGNGSSFLDRAQHDHELPVSWLGTQHTRS
jgi:hypothetical protein